MARAIRIESMYLGARAGQASITRRSNFDFADRLMNKEAGGVFGENALNQLGKGDRAKQRACRSRGWNHIPLE
jgi:hypothetical protein